MLKSLVLSILAFCTFPTWGQSIASLNFHHQYDAKNEVDLSMKLVNEGDHFTLYYRLQRGDQFVGEHYAIDWLKFESYTEKVGVVIPGIDSAALEGKISLPIPEKSWILAAKVTNINSTVSWRYLQIIDPKYPVNGYLSGPNGIVYKPYLPAGQSYTFQSTDSRPLKVFFYRTDFAVASPPFTDKGARVDRFMFPDSSFQVTPGESLMLKSKGLYLAQQDTAQAKGFSFVVTGKSYPKLTRIEDIPDPLIFVSTKDEHNALLAAGSDKSKIDKVILDITRDKDRAKNFMRSYFRRVELANYYFTSFKEGWKTDRGMIYLIFGNPDEVGRTGPNEVWFYKNIRERFTFVKNGSIYDPNSLVLQRNSRYMERWFDTVDQWRKSRYQY